jgi:large subunit ribosomal protein L35
MAGSVLLRSDPSDRTQHRSTNMPKQKTHKGVKKRFRVTAKGKVKHRQSGTSHLAARMTHKRKRMLRGTEVLADEFTPQIKTMLAGNSY